jgi:hypothetical protein
MLIPKRPPKPVPWYALPDRLKPRRIRWWVWILVALAFPAGLLLPVYASVWVLLFILVVIRYSDRLPPAAKREGDP